MFTQTAKVFLAWMYIHVLFKLAVFTMLIYQSILIPKQLFPQPIQSAAMCFPHLPLVAPIDNSLNELTSQQTGFWQVLVV